MSRFSVIPAYVLERPDLRGTLPVLCVLGTFTDRDGWAFPSQGKMAEVLGISQQAVSKHIKTLVDAGVVESVAQYREDGSQTANKYRILFDVDVAPVQPTVGGGTTPEVVGGTTPEVVGGTTPEVVAIRSQVNAPIEGNLNDAKASLVPGAKAPGTKAPTCPHQAIIDLYHEILPMCPQVREWNDLRRRLLQTRWRENVKRQTLAWWRKYFTHVAQSEFLTGRADNRGRRPFLADLEWLVRPSNLARVIEGKYHEDAA